VRNNEPAQEVWLGTSFALAALLLSEGLKDQAYQTARGIHHVVYETKGYWFRAPEAGDDLQRSCAETGSHAGQIHQDSRFLSDEI
jgi:uncharacterized protein (DUF608 family)